MDPLVDLTRSLSIVSAVWFLFSDFFVDFREEETEVVVDTLAALRFKADDDDEDVVGVPAPLDAVVVVAVDDDTLEEMEDTVSSCSSSQNFFFRRSLFPETAAKAGPSCNFEFTLHPFTALVAGEVVVVVVASL